jgi:hypothetical protein
LIAFFAHAVASQYPPAAAGNRPAKGTIGAWNTKALLNESVASYRGKRTEFVPQFRFKDNSILGEALDLHNLFEVAAFVGAASHLHAARLGILL